MTADQTDQPDHEPQEARQGKRIVPKSHRIKGPEWGLLAAIVAVLALIYFVDSSHAFFRAYSVQTLFHRVALFGVLAIGAAVVIISGGSTSPPGRWWPWRRWSAPS